MKKERFNTWFRKQHRELGCHFVREYYESSGKALYKVVEVRDTQRTLWQRVFMLCDRHYYESDNPRIERIEVIDGSKKEGR